MSRLRALVRALSAALTLAALLAGIPYTLLHEARRWLPPGVPSWDAVTAWLAAPYDTVALLQLLDVACWVLWLWLALQTLAELAWYTAHSRELLGPTAGGAALLAARRTLAGMLIAALVLGLASALRAGAAPGQRVTLGTAAWSAPPTATAPALPSTVLRVTERRSCTVKAGDNLWDLATRHLGDPERWREIYQLNAHQPQDDGRILTDPDLIYPGWTLLLPGEPIAPQIPAPATPTTPTPSPPTVAPAPSSTAVPTPAPVSDPSGAHRHEIISAHAHAHGIELTGPGGYISLALAAALSATATTVMRRRRRGYQPEDLTTAQRPAPHNPEETGLLTSLRRSTDLRSDAMAAGAASTTKGSSAVGRLTVAATATGTQVTLVDLLVGQRLPALTLTGEGALHAARALLVTVLAESSDCHRLILSREDLALLLTDRTPAPEGPGLTVTDDPQASIDALEEALLLRARRLHEHGADAPVDENGLVVLLGRATTYARPRLSALLAASHERGLAAVLLNPEPTPLSATAGLPGAAFRVAADGQAARLNDDGTLATPLRMFHLPVGSTEILCTLLAHHSEFQNIPTGDSEEDREPAPEEPRESPEFAPPGPSGESDINSPAVPVGIPARARPAVALLHSPKAPPLAVDTEPLPPIEADPVGDGPSAHRSPCAPPTVPTLPSPTQTVMPALRSVPVYVRVMGPLRVEVRDTAVTRGMAGAPGELLAYLALHSDGASKESIEEALWPDRAPDKREEAFNTAKKTVRKHLREAMGSGTVMFIVALGTRWRLDPQHVATDYTAFEKAVKASHTAPDTAARLEACRTVADLYSETLCAGSDFPWATAAREDARRRTVNALSTLATAATKAGDTDRSVQHLTQALIHDPHGEELHLRLARLHAACGESDAVRRLLDQLTANNRAIGERTTQATTTEFHALLRPAAVPGNRTRQGQPAQRHLQGRPGS